MFTKFQPEPVVNFSEDGPHRRMQDFIQRAMGDLGRTYPLVIAGHRWHQRIG